MSKLLKARARPLFSGWHLLPKRGHPIAGRQARGLLWLKSVRKIEEGRARHFVEVTI